MSSDPFWFSDYTILFDKDRLLEFFPTEDQTNVEKLNSLVRYSIYAAAVLLFFKKTLNVALIPLFTLILTLYIFKYSTVEEVLRPFEIDEEMDQGQCTMPDEHNIFMNVMPHHLTEGVEKPKACKSTDAVKETIDELYYKNMYRDVGDVFGRSNGEMRFHTVPETAKEFGGIKHGNTVGFANYLYGDNTPTCKEDNQECIGTYNQYDTESDLRRSANLVTVQDGEGLNIIGGL